MLHKVGAPLGYPVPLLVPGLPVASLQIDALDLQLEGEPADIAAHAPTLIEARLTVWSEPASNCPSSRPRRMASRLPRSPR